MSESNGIAVGVFSKRRCVICAVSFRASPRLQTRQKTCGKACCVRSHRAAYRRQYRKSSQEAELGYQQKRKASQGVDYWKQYRDAHPVSTARNRANSRLRKLLLKSGLQRQLDIVQLIDPIEKLDVVVGFATSHRSLLEECLCKACG